MIIRIKPGSMIIELTDRGVMPQFAHLQASIVVEAEVHYDTDGDHVYEFSYLGRLWTVGHEDVEVLS